jgi:predicted nucleic acid-binding protein
VTGLCYLDTSAVLRMLDQDHPSREPIEEYLTGQDLWGSLCTSRLTYLEGMRVAIRDDNAELAAVLDSIFEEIPVISISDEVLGVAMEIPFHVNSLDAIHIASAMELNVATVVTYDQNMIRVLESLRSDSRCERTVPFRDVVAP